MSCFSAGMVFCVWKKMSWFQCATHAHHVGRISSSQCLELTYKYAGSSGPIQLARRCRREHMSSINSDMNTDMNTASKNTVYLCVQCGREFYVKEYLLRHSLVHKACVHCGKTSPKHKCHKTLSAPVTKEEAKKPYLNSFHYKLHLK